MAPKRGRKAAAAANLAMKQEQENGDDFGEEEQQMVIGGGGGGAPPPPASTEHVEVKTKFPVARIKRIMQADDDVGKVAQVTPVVVCEFYSIPYLVTQLP